MRGLTEILSSIFEARGKNKGNAPAPELELSKNGVASGLYSSHSHAAISRSVLSDPGENEAAADLSDDLPLSRTIGVGEDLRLAEEAIMEAGKALKLLSDQPTAGYIGRLLSLIESQQCQIAFIGQMNAGKSSLINALIGSPDFLPAEITPWTTVVTNLYFGVPHKPTSGAVFEFFDETEWRQLAEGHGRVRALTEQVMPDFPWESLHRQVEEMRERAEKTLGPRYRELLGGKHEYETVTAGMLERYIAAESPLEDEDGPAPGEYSMITKAAHIYSDLSSFFYPTIVIDTPGINDPFLIRDEITRHNLERANIFIVVVTARQPLSNADLDLLRVLRGLKKENFIIFVNKIDEMEDFETHREALIGRIRTLLKREFPEKDIPIIAGSAYWADLALSNNMDELQEVGHWAVSPASPVSLGANGDTAFWLSDASAERTVLAETALTKSSIPDLGIAISNMLRSGPVAARLNHAASALQAMAKNGAAFAKADSQLIRELNRASQEKQTLQATVGKLTELRQSASAVVKDIGENYAGIVGAAEIALKARLDQDVKAILSSATEAEAGTKAVSPATVRNSLLSKLRSGLETSLSQAFQDTVSQINLLTHEAEAKLHEAADTAGETLGVQFEYPALPPLKCSPSLAALSEPIVTEFGASAYGTSWTKPLEAAECEQLIHAIEAQFATIREELVKAAASELEQTTAFILDHFRSNLLHRLDLLIAQREAMLSEVPVTNEENEKRLAQLESDAKAYDDVIATLARIKIGAAA